MSRQHSIRCAKICLSSHHFINDIAVYKASCTKNKAIIFFVQFLTWIDVRNSSLEECLGMGCLRHKITIQFWLLLYSILEYFSCFKIIRMHYICALNHIRTNLSSENAIKEYPNRAYIIEAKLSR